jgi:hypothetical protein
MEIEKGLVSCGRGFSKTLCSAVAVLWYVDIYAEETGRPVKIMLVSSQDVMYEYVNQYFNSDTLKAKLIKKGVYTQVPVEGFELTDGSKVFTKPATGKVRSNRCNILFLDETADIPEEVIKSAMNCLSGDINILRLISTPHKSGYFTVRASEPEKYGYTMKQFSSEVCPWMTKTVARAKIELTSAEYAIDILGRPPTKDERTFFANKHIDACIQPEVIREGLPQSRIEAGIDFGEVVCKTVIVITEKTFSKRNILYIKEWAHKSVESIGPEIAEILDRFNPVIIKADAKPDGCIAILNKFTKRKIHSIDAAQGHKEPMLGQLQKKVQTHELRIPEAQITLITQMRKYRRGLRTGDDQVDALALSCYEPAVPLSQKKTVRVVF